MITENNLLLPDELERRQIFHLLKKHSSWTAWNRILSYYQKWADITEESVRIADNNGLLPKKIYPPDYTTPPGVRDDMGQTSIYYRDFVDILKGLALFDEGVRRLGKGDKRVFTRDEASGLFARAGSYTNYYFTAKGKLEDGEIGWQETTPLMKEFFEALSDLGDAGSECARYIYERKQYRSPEVNAASFRYGLDEMVFLPQLPYPDPLPELPEIFDIVEIKTGEEIPCTGIWQPVKNGQPICAMNYLHEGTFARQAVQLYKADPANKNIDRDEYYTIDEGYIFEIKDVTWRLLWRDNRYEDGTIPAEEENYQFVEPSPEGFEGYYNVYDAAAYLRRHNLPNPLLDGEHRLISCHGGKPCPQDGFWWTPASEQGKGHFKKGDIMPNYPMSQYGATIWYREKRK